MSLVNEKAGAYKLSAGAVGVVRKACASVVLGVVLGLAVPVAGEGVLRAAGGGLSADARLQVEADPLVMRWRVARMDGDAVFDAWPAAQPMVLNLFDDVEVKARVQRAKDLGGGSRFLSGALEGGGHFTLFRHSTGIVRGEVHSGAGVYTLRSQGPGRVLVKQEDVSKLPGCGNHGLMDEPVPLVPAMPGRRDVRSSGWARAGALSSLPVSVVPVRGATSADTEAASEPIDVLVLYTQRVEDHEGGPEQIQATIENEMAKTNHVLENSGLSHRRMRLAAAEKVDYEQSDHLQGDLLLLERSASEHGTDYGALDEVFPLIEKHKADLVHLFVRNGREACGKVAIYSGSDEYWVQKECENSDHYDLCLYNNRRENWRSQRYSISAIRCLGGYTFAHELGHSMGLFHARFSNNGDNSYIERGFFPHFKPYSFGYQNMDFSEICQITVMSTGDACYGAGIYGQL